MEILDTAEEAVDETVGVLGHRLPVGLPAEEGLLADLLGLTQEYAEELDHLADVTTGPLHLEPLS